MRRAPARASASAPPPQPTPPRAPRRAAAAAAATTAAALLTPAAALAAAATAVGAHVEPSNALSLPTWAIHVSSVAEWGAAMALFWRLEAATGAPWRAVTWGMLPALGGALCACTFHFFYNPPELYPIVAVQAGLTLVGNVTLAAGAFVVWNATRAPDKEKKEG